MSLRPEPAQYFPNPIEENYPSNLTEDQIQKLREEFRIVMRREGEFALERRIKRRFRSPLWVPWGDQFVGGRPSGHVWETREQTERSLQYSLNKAAELLSITMSEIRPASEEQ